MLRNGVQLCQKHHICHARTVINGMLIGKKNLWAEFGAQGSGEHYTACLIALVHARVWQFLYEYWVKCLHLQIFLCVLPRCWLWHMNIWFSFLSLLWEQTINTVINYCVHHHLCYPSPTSWLILNSAKGESMFLLVQQYNFSWWSLIKLFLKQCHHFGQCLVSVWHLVHPLATNHSSVE